MAVDTDIVELVFTNIVADVPIMCDMQTYSVDHITVKYGNAKLTATRDVDYSIELNEEGEFADFTIVPTVALIANIDALIAASVSETNIIHVERFVPYTNDMVSTDGFLRSKIVRQFDLLVMMMQQLNADFSLYADVQKNLEAAQAAAGIAQVSSATAVSAAATAVTAKDLILAQDFTTKAEKATTITVSGGLLTGGGSLAADRVIGLTIADIMTALAAQSFMCGMCFSIPATTIPATVRAVKRNGALLSRATYANLWAFANASGNIVSDATWLAGAFGAFSTGDGSTTFRVMDDRGYFERGYDDARGIDTGRVMTAVQADALKDHSHSLPFGNGNLAGSGINVIVPGTGISTGAVNAPDNGGTETRPKNTAKLQVIGY